MNGDWSNSVPGRQIPEEPIANIAMPSAHHRLPVSLHQAPMSSHRPASFQLFHNVLKVFHDVLLVVHNVLRVFDDVLQVFHDVFATICIHDRQSPKGSAITPQNVALMMLAWSHANSVLNGDWSNSVPGRQFPKGLLRRVGKFIELSIPNYNGAIPNYDGA